MNSNKPKPQGNQTQQQFNTTLSTENVNGKDIPVAVHVERVVVNGLLIGSRKTFGGARDLMLMNIETLLI